MHKSYLTLIVLALVSAKAHAAGFEKSVMWSGKYSGTAGAAAVGGVSGSQSLFFNPAGLAKDGDVSLNYSPTWIGVRGYLASPTTQEETDRNSLTSGDVSASYVVSDRFGFGAAAYVIGGERAVYNDVDLTGDAATAAFTPKLETDLAITEYALGAGAEVIPGLRLGAAWRISKAKGSISTLKKTVGNTAYVYNDIEDAQQTRYKGFKLGAQYEDPANHGWGVGATYRNGVTFDATSTNVLGGTYVIPTQTAAPATFSPVTVSITLPSQWAVGGWYRLSDNFRVMAALDVTQYSVDQFALINGTITSATLGGTSNLPSLTLNWNDQWNFRFGGEYEMGSVALRAGYSHTNQVTSSTDAKATLAPAGVGHLLAFGAGTTFARNWGLDGALELGWNNGNGSMSATPTGASTKELLAGAATDTQARTFAVHTGVTYKF